MTPQQSGEKRRIVHLSDPELALLDGKVNAKAQEVVAGAVERLRAIEQRPDLSPVVAGFVADVIREANDNGEVVLQPRRIRHCSLCGKYAGYYRFKSGMRRGQEDLKRPLTFRGYEMAQRFVSVEHHVRLGGCDDCVEPLIPVLADALRGIPAQVDSRLRAEGEPKRTRHPRRHCTKCDWRGHEGEMGRRRTLMGDGTYPAACPACGVENGFGHHPVEHADGFVIAEPQP